jgi:hypothetical protein
MAAFIPEKAKTFSSWQKSNKYEQNAPAYTR